MWDWGFTRKSPIPTKDNKTVDGESCYPNNLRELAGSCYPNNLREGAGSTGSLIMKTVGRFLVAWVVAAVLPLSSASADPKKKTAFSNAPHGWWKKGRKACKSEHSNRTRLRGVRYRRMWCEVRDDMDRRWYIDGMYQEWYRRGRPKMMGLVTNLGEGGPTKLWTLERWYFWHRTGKPAATGEFSTDTGGPHAHLEWIFYWPSGKLRARGHFREHRFMERGGKPTAPRGTWVFNDQAGNASRCDYSKVRFDWGMSPPHKDPCVAKMLELDQLIDSLVPKGEIVRRFRSKNSRIKRSKPPIKSPF